MKRIPILAITIAILTAVLLVVPAAAEEYATGLIHDSEETIQSHLIEYEPSYETTLPSSVDLTDEFPAPGNQGSQNSCIGWAVAYALKSHQEETARHWGLDTDEHLFSPSYIYNQLCHGSDNGIALALALDLIKEQGVCTLASFPYNARDYVTQPTEEQKNEAALYAASAWHTIHGTDSIKKRLSEGDGVIIAIDLYPDFYNISESDPVYDILYGSVKGYHAVCLVGYDDNKQCYGGVKGAFKFINSWGTSWGLDGYGWISYDMLSYGEVGRGYGYIVDAGEPLYYEGDFQYTVKDGEAEIKRYIGSGGDVEIPETLGGYAVTKIGNYAFENCETLTNVTIPDTVAGIGRHAFYACEALENITIPDSVVKIEAGTFSQCSSLKTVFIGSGINEVVEPFGLCESLERIDVHPENAFFASKDGVLFDKTMKTLIRYPQAKSGAYTIPDSVEEIGDGAFIYCDGLTDIAIPSSVKRIGEYAFFSCGIITKVIIPEGVEEIGDGAFNVCLDLKKLVLPDSVIKIGIDMCTLPNGFSPTTVYCNAGTYAHAYANLNCPQYDALMSVPTLDGGVEELTIVRDSFSLHRLRLENSDGKALYFAVYDNGALKRAYTADNGEISDIDWDDIESGKAFIWDGNMKPLTVPIDNLIPYAIAID